MCRDTLNVIVIFVYSFWNSQCHCFICIFVVTPSMWLLYLHIRCVYAMSLLYLYICRDTVNVIVIYLYICCDTLNVIVVFLYLSYITDTTSTSLTAFHHRCMFFVIYRCMRLVWTDCDCLDRSRLPIGYRFAQQNYLLYSTYKMGSKLHVSEQSTNLTGYAIR